MKKNFKFYAVIWAIVFAVFNVICFIIPTEGEGAEKYSDTFWVGYAFIIVAFIGNLVCAFIAFRAENLKKMFYNVPLITVSYTGLVLMLIFGGLCMAIKDLPTWVGIIVCLLILAFNAIAVIRAGWAGDAVSDIDEKIKEQTRFIKLLIVDAQGLVNRAKSEAVKAECQKVYDIVRYSDPMADEALSVIEAKITVKMDEFGSAVSADNAEQAKDIADELVILAKDRNEKCKALK